MVATGPDIARAIYGGDPYHTPAYFLGNAAHYLRLPAATVRSWALGRRYPSESGWRTFPPLISIADSERKMVSFCNLVELHILSSIRRIHRVEMQAVRRALEYLRKKFKSEHPLLDREMLTDGKSLFIEQYGEVVNISQGGQMEMQRLLDVYLRRVERGKHGIPIRLFPFTRSSVEQAPRLISIDPKVRFGKPCIAGTGVPTALIAERHQAGDSVALLAEDYGRSPEEIEEAIRYEHRSAAA